MAESARGVKLGRYEVLKHLASGGMAEVLLAKALGIEGFERYVVIKRIHVEHARDPQAISMFLDEARLAASLHHHNIAQVHDVGKEKGEYFFAMEYVHGEDLRTLLRHASENESVIPLEHIVAIVSGVAAGLQHAHDQLGADRKPLGIVHRDVSPGNILVGYDGSVKLVDFGIAKAALRSAETHSGTIKGKIAYMSVEQCLGQPVDRRSDIFSLGIVLYELTTVRRLFKGASDFLTMTAIVNGDVPPPSIYRTDLPKALEQIIMKALSSDAARRYQNASELGVAVDDFAIAHGLRPSTAKLADYMEAQFGRRPEPWLVEDDTPELSIVDFDDSGDGLAPIAPGVAASASETSPIGRARKRDTNAPPISDTATTGPIIALSSVKDTAAPDSQTPLGWPKTEASATGARTRGRKMWLVGGVLAVAAAGGIVMYNAPDGDVTGATAPPPTPREPPRQPTVEPLPTPAPETAPEPTIPATGDHPLRDERGMPTRVAPRTTPPSGAPLTPNKRWDPNKLLPK